MKLKPVALILSLFVFLFSSLEAAYISVDQLTPGQVRFSSKNVEQKISAALKKKEALYDSATDTYLGKYFSGKSMFPEEEALPVIRAPFGLVLVDGHHHTLASLTLGLPYIPIKEIDDLSSFSSEDFWKEAEKKGYVYPYNVDGQKQIPSTFSDLQDDPNRYFAALTARKYPEDKDVKRSIGAEYPLWIKIGKDIPFIEFHISDALKKMNFEYFYHQGDTPSADFVEQARKILVEARIPGLRVVPTRVHYSQLFTRLKLPDFLSSASKICPALIRHVGKCH